MPSLDDDARQYVRLAVALGERDPDSLDFYAGPADAVADIRRSPPPLTAIKRDARALARASRCISVRGLGRIRRSRSRSGERTRAQALVARSRGDRRARRSADRSAAAATRRRASSFFGIAPEPIEETRLAAIRAQIADLIGGGERLVDRYAAFRGAVHDPADAPAAGDGGGARRVPRGDGCARDAAGRASRPGSNSSRTSRGARSRAISAAGAA